MKNSIRAIGYTARAIGYTAMTALIVMGSETALLAQDHATPTVSSGLSAGQAIGGFILLLLLLLAPLTKRTNKATLITRQ